MIINVLPLTMMPAPFRHSSLSPLTTSTHSHHCIYQYHRSAFHLHVFKHNIHIHTLAYLRSEHTSHSISYENRKHVLNVHYTRTRRYLHWLTATLNVCEHHHAENMNEIHSDVNDIIIKCFRFVRCIGQRCCCVHHIYHPIHSCTVPCNNRTVSTSDLHVFSRNAWPMAKLTMHSTFAIAIRCYWWL